MFDPLSLLFGLVVGGGGVVGYVRAGSTASLVSGLAFGALLLLGSHHLAKGDARLLLGGSVCLAILMCMRYSKTGKFIPAGLIGFLSLLMTLRCTYILWS
uniref:Expressed conserved protein n=1 Tax=Echinococcus granulosus TaxID=6210 RepID=A0A068WNV8_ECHGR|nr:expressed conserved protein [Echinococcus granulosus]